MLTLIDTDILVWSCQACLWPKNGHILPFWAIRDSLNFAKQFLSLLQRICEETGHCSLMPHHTQLESAVSLHPRVFNCVTTSKEVILSAQKEDLQNIRLCGNEKMDIIEHQKCILHGWHQGMLLQLNIGGAEREANNKEWEVLDEFLAKARGAKEEGME